MNEHNDTIAPTPGELRRAPEAGASASPLLTFAEAGEFLRISAGSVAKLIAGRSDVADSELATALRSFLVAISPRRRYINRALFLNWLNRRVADAEAANISPDMGSPARHLCARSDSPTNAKEAS